MTATNVAMDNVERARAIFADFDPHSPAWQANLSDDVEMIFPYAASIGLPPVVEGKEACVGVFQAVACGHHFFIRVCVGDLGGTHLPDVAHTDGGHR